MRHYEEAACEVCGLPAVAVLGPTGPDNAISNPGPAWLCTDHMLAALNDQTASIPARPPAREGLSDRSL